jgi:hypothetical protein
VVRLQGGQQTIRMVRSGEGHGGWVSLSSKAFCLRSLALPWLLGGRSQTWALSSPIGTPSGLTASDGCKKIPRLECGNELLCVRSRRIVERHRHDLGKVVEDVPLLYGCEKSIARVTCAVAQRLSMVFPTLRHTRPHCIHVRQTALFRAILKTCPPAVFPP